MNPALLIQALAMFAVTNIDDMVLLAVYFSQVGTDRAGIRRVVTGQYLGFGAILIVAVIGALGAGLLPAEVIPYLGLLPLLLGVRAAWSAWKDRADADDGLDDKPRETMGIWQIAVVTFANGGDNIGVYVPVFAVARATGMVGYIMVFLIGLALWCALGWYLASRPAVAGVLARWGHVVLPVVLIAIGVIILVEGGAFGL